MIGCLPSSIRPHVIPSGLDFDKLPCLPPPEARRLLKLPASERLILFIGSPDEARKRYDLARRAVAILNETLPAKLILAWLVAYESIPVYMSACDVLVCTSFQEGSPNVVKEALACNLPVVSVAVGDVRYAATTARKRSRLPSRGSCGGDNESGDVKLSKILTRGCWPPSSLRFTARC
jgi:glycosyltransferase involved in cell wall biosynthesis